MKVLSIYILMFTSCILESYAQTSDSVRAIVIYSFSQLRDTNKAEHFYSEDMQLLIGKNQTCYKTAIKARADSIMTANFIKSGMKSMTAIPYSNEEIYFSQSDQTCFVKERLSGSNFLMQDTWPKINWQIFSDTSTIANFHCQKAVGTWRGRTYVAWFCNTLPFNAGPWKLRGLPGLIVEAYDLKKRIVFKFMEYKTMQKSFQTITLPKNAVKTNPKDYNRMLDAFNHDRAGFINSTMGKTAVKSDSKSPANPINYPMEL